jgi:two-component system nitrate/nitrite response regulator NarL
MITALKPDFAILDLHMPNVTGVEAIRRLRHAGATVKLMILSISREEGTVMEALRAGADAYLLKDGPSRHLLDAIGFVKDGGVYVSPMLRGAGLFTKSERTRQEDPLAALSPREWKFSPTWSMVYGRRISPTCWKSALRPSTLTAPA